VQPVFTDKAILTIIKNYTKEAGVRDLERNIASILRKITTEIVLNKQKKKYKLGEKEIEEYLGKKKYFDEEIDNQKTNGVVNGLAYTDFGGTILPIEATYFKGKGNLILTGSLGEVMKESAEIALSYVKSNYEKFDIAYDLLENSDIHINAVEGAIPKDGPSAGITLVTAIISAFTNKEIDNKIGMTGEITLRGNILPIGGLKEKVIGGYRSGIRTIILPYKNEKDLDEIPKEIKKEINFILVKQYEDVYKQIVKQ